MGFAKLTDTPPSRNDTKSDRFLSGEILRHYCHAGQKETSEADSDCDTLCENKLPVGLADTGHHHTKTCAKCPQRKEQPKVAEIEEWPHNSASKEDQKGLNRAYPRDIGGRLMFEDVRLIKGLKGPVHVDHTPDVRYKVSAHHLTVISARPSPSVEVEDKGSYDLEPGVKAPIWSLT